MLVSQKGKIKYFNTAIGFDLKGNISAELGDGLAIDNSPAEMYIPKSGKCDTQEAVLIDYLDSLKIKEKDSIKQLREY